MSTSTSLGFQVNTLARQMRRAFELELQGSPLTLAQARVLFHLARSPGLRQVTLAERLEVQPITLARLVDQLERLQWVERRTDATDRRAHQLYLTEAAQAPLKDIERVSLKVRKQVLQGFEPQEVTQLQDLLSRMHNNLTQI